MAGPNPLKPDLMTADERLSEVALILAAGLLRLRSRGTSGTPAKSREGSLDCAAHPSGRVLAKRAGARR